MKFLILFLNLQHIFDNITAVPMLSPQVLYMRLTSKVCCFVYLIVTASSFMISICSSNFLFLTLFAIFAICLLDFYFVVHDYCFVFQIALSIYDFSYFYLQISSLVPLHTSSVHSLINIIRCSFWCSFFSLIIVCSFD